MKRSRVRINRFAAFAMILFCAAGIQRAAGQVSVVIDKTTKEITITNRESSAIVFFKITQEYDGYKPEGKKFDKCGIVSPKLPSSKQLAAGAKIIVTDVDIKQPFTQFCYYLLEGTNKVTTKKVVPVADESSKPAVSEPVKPTPAPPPVSASAPDPVVPPKAEPSAVADKPVVEEAKPVPAPVPTAAEQRVAAPSKPAKKVEPKKTEPKKEEVTPPDKAPTFTAAKETIEKDILGLTKKDSIVLKREGKNAKNLEQTIRNEIVSLIKLKEKAICPTCNDLIDSYGAINDGVREVMATIAGLLSNFSEDKKKELRQEYDKFVYKDIRITTDIAEIKIIKIKIEEKTRSSLTGWVGKKDMLEQLDKLENNFDTIKARSEFFITKNCIDYPHEVEFIKNLEYIPNNYKIIKEYKRDLDRISVPYISLSLIGVMLLLCITGAVFYIRTYMKNTRIKKVEKEKEDSGERGLLILEDDEEEIVSYNVGLDDARKTAGTDYYEVDMTRVSPDTTIRKVYLSRKAILDMYKFFSNFLKYESKTNETGCFLVGRWEHVPYTDNQVYDITIESIVEPGDDAIYGEYNLNFGAKIGVTLNYAIEELCEKTGNEYVHTCWMHSHPGLGLFLSSQDLSVQSQLAHSNHRGRMLAIVIDSNTPNWETAFFSPKQNGAMNNDKDIKNTFYMETLYRWAKSLPQPPQPSSKNLENYYEIPQQSTESSKIFFSGSSIIDVDAAIMPDAVGLQGYFYGEKTPTEICIDNFHEKEQDGQTPVTCLWVVPHFSMSELQTDDNYKSTAAHFDVSIVYSLENGSLYVLTKKEIITSPLMEMKEWTRRKR